MSSLPIGALLPLSKISLPPLLFLRDDVDYDSLPSSSPFSLSFSPTQVLGAFDHYLHLASPLLPLSFARQWTVRFFPCLAFLPSFRLRAREGVHFFLNGLHPFPIPLPLAAAIEKPKPRPLPRYVKISGSRNLITEQRESLYLFVDRVNTGTT